jgi:hypothetical protein
MSNVEEGIDVGEGSAGEAHERKEGAGAEEERPPIAPEELDERQEKFRTTRRQGGPDLHAETEARDEGVEEVPDIPPTEPEV